MKPSWSIFDCRQLISFRLPLTGLDQAGADKAVNHLRSMLEHAGVLAARDEPLARFERWLSVKLEVVTEPAVRGPIEQFATWHHLRRLRQTTVPGQGSAAAVRYAKQEITEAIKFLTWLHSTHHRTLATCLQLDVDEWLVSGPTMRSKIRNLLAWAKKARLNRSVHITHRQAPPSRSLTQQQRLAWLRELLTGDSETLPYRVAGTLLLLFAQPLSRIAALPTSAIATTDNDVQISLGREPIPRPAAVRRYAHQPHWQPAQSQGRRWDRNQPVAFSRCPGRPARGPTSDQGKARTAGHRSARRPKHHLAKPCRRGTATGSRRTTRLQLRHNPASRRDRSPALGPVCHQTLTNDLLNFTSTGLAPLELLRTDSGWKGWTPLVAQGRNHQGLEEFAVRIPFGSDQFAYPHLVRILTRSGLTGTVRWDWPSATDIPERESGRSPCEGRGKISQGPPPHPRLPTI